MSAPPPPPQISPDGKFYWDGTRWVPMQVPVAPEPPLPGQLSPDSKYYWDAERWVPVALAAEAGIAPVVPVPTAQNVGCVTRTTCLTVVGLFVLVALVLLIAGVCSSIASHH